MEFPLQFSILITIGIVIMLVYYIWKGYRNGLVLEAIITISLLLCVCIGWWLSDVMKDVFLLVPASLLNTGITTLDKLVVELANRMAWFGLLFVVVNILLRIARGYIRKLNKLTLVGSVNQVLGSVLAFCKGLIYTIIIIVFISSPIFSNGKVALDKAGLIPIRTMIGEHVPIAKNVLQVFDTVDKAREDGNFDWETLIEQ
ncbi:putative membrane protein required for colicin V production [Breznakia sp. PF5-3]|uniref:CvpA family protein n=1 Tax=unclassified Breznakia TaxID=2623764 RepID=UPI0024060613|nr:MULTISPECIES: CvpA family protein [unclassified Breznakia]MDF9824053.1 putative membrane protein required for colicin V production [Breznakia sp. PM6-1]MDF9834881.1 putative membrane protein required for colicin V production [Breznakia sp. PF5-3]MDF9837097.1 putative membrane protein required for colicin V production [Breznakia sp. PFB2-8]MDF9859022.1 putative membrane protein required for colicin V production [Breznakia sp. PH5-24]